MKQKKEKRNRLTAHGILGILFLLILILFGVLNVLYPDRIFSETENRMLEQKPELHMAGILDGKFMRSFEKYQTDQFFERDGWIRMRTSADQLLGKNKSNDVYLGKNGQLYEEPASLTDRVWKNLDAIQEFSVQHTQQRHYLMLVPGAAGVQPEGLPAFAPVEDQMEQLEMIRAYLGDAVQEIPVEEALKAHKEEYLYYRTDHHWTTLGAYYAYEQAVQVMELSSKRSFLPEELTTQFEGTLSARSGYQAEPDTIFACFPEEEEELVVTYVSEQKKSASLYASEKLNTKDKYGVFLDGNHPMVEIRTMAESERKLLLLKDSYANCFVPFLTDAFREIILIDPRYYYGELEELIQEKGVTDVLYLYNLNTFLEDDVLHFALENSSSTEE